MNNYANTFYTAYNKDRDEVVISLKQQYPVFNSPENGNTVVQEDDIANFVIRAKVAKALSDAIQDMLESDDETK